MSQNCPNIGRIFVSFPGYKDAPISLLAPFPFYFDNSHNISHAPQNVSLEHRTKCISFSGSDYVYIPYMRVGTKKKHNAQGNKDSIIRLLNRHEIETKDAV